jgi:5-methylcytosine-specific restriction protein A
MFELGKLYRRRDLHHQWGGQQQGGIVPPSKHSMVWLITGDAGSPYGYDDEQLADGSFLLRRRPRR